MLTPSKNQKSISHLDSEKPKRRNDRLLTNTTNNTTICSSSPRTEKQKSLLKDTSTYSNKATTTEESCKEKRKPKQVYKMTKPICIVDESNSKVPRMVQIIKHNEMVKEEMRLNSWKYADVIPKKQPKKLSDLQILILSQYYPDRFYKKKIVQK